MARKKGDSINVSIFMALKVSEKSNVPVLLMSNPGVGKTTTVEIYAKLRGYDVVVLRGNSTSPEEVMGYETCPSDVTSTGETKASVHLRPSWFDQVLKNDEQGIKTLLFLDELTTANEFVQASLLELIFGRKCGMEFLPSSCLIVAAGNYMANLTASMTVIAPVLNRFMIYNITPEVSDLDTFLNRYKGAIVSSGKVKGQLGMIEKQLEDLDKQEIEITPEKRNMIGEYLERAVSETTRMLITSSKDVDLSVTDLQNVYADVNDQDPNLYGFPTFRTLGYLTEVAIATYQCFGKAGLQSDNFFNMINGLCGIGLKKGDKSTNYEVQKNKIGKEYFTSISQAVVEIEKMSNSKLPEYEKFFINLVNDEKKSSFSDPEINAIINKLEELKNDKEVSNIERPIDPEILTNICKVLKTTAVGITKFKVETGDKFIDKVPLEKFAGTITSWNNIAQVATSIDKLINDSNRGYKPTTKTMAKDTMQNLANVGYRIRSIKKLMVQENSGIVNAIPEIKAIDASK